MRRPPGPAGSWTSAAEIRTWGLRKTVHSSILRGRFATAGSGGNARAGTERTGTAGSAFLGLVLLRTGLGSDRIEEGLNPLEPAANLVLRSLEAFQFPGCLQGGCELLLELPDPAAEPGVLVGQQPHPPFRLTEPSCKVLHDASAPAVSGSHPAPGTAASRRFPALRPPGRCRERPAAGTQRPACRRSGGTRCSS